MAKRRMARGWFGGSLSKETGMVTVEITVPVVTGLDLDEATLHKKVGQALATDIRKSLRAGRQPDGGTLPDPIPAKGVGTPLNRSGKLIDSIKYRDGWVAPSTNLRSDVGKRARSNFGLMKILISGIFWPRHRYTVSKKWGLYRAEKASIPGAQQHAVRPMIDPLGSQDPKLPEKINALARKVMAKMVIKLRGRSEKLKAA